MRLGGAFQQMAKPLAGSQDMSQAKSQVIIAAKSLSNEDLADCIHELNDELEQRCRSLPGNWLKRQLDGAQLTVRSWSSQHQANMKANLDAGSM